MTNKNQNRPSLSDFTRPSKKRPQDNNAQLKTPVNEPRLDSLEQSEHALPPASPEEQEAQDRLNLYEQMQDTMSPVEDYRKYLKELNISEEEAACIVDDLMTKGYYEETFKLSKTRRCTLRTRSHRDTIRLQTAMQIQRPLFQDALNELQARYNVAASLSAYNGEVYYFAEPKDSQDKGDKLFDERLQAVECMPAPIFSMVSLMLAKFDQKVLAVLRPGVVENF